MSDADEGLHTAKEELIMANGMAERVKATEEISAILAEGGSLLVQYPDARIARVDGGFRINAAGAIDYTSGVLVQDAYRNLQTVLAKFIKAEFPPNLMNQIGQQMLSAAQNIRGAINRWVSQNPEVKATGYTGGGPVSAAIERGIEIRRSREDYEGGGESKDSKKDKPPKDEDKPPKEEKSGIAGLLVLAVLIGGGVFAYKKWKARQAGGK